MNGAALLRGVATQALLLGDLGLRDFLWQRTQLQLSHEHLGPFGLQQNLTVRGLHVGGVIDQGAIHEVCQRVALAVTIDSRPFVSWAFDVILAPKVDDVFPVGVAS